MKKISSKQASRQKLLSELKKEKINRQVNKEGYAFCERCFKPYRREVAHEYLDLHHKILRAQLGGDSPENLDLICRPCHQLEHN